MRTLSIKRWLFRRKRWLLFWTNVSRKKEKETGPPATYNNCYVAIYLCDIRLTAIQCGANTRIGFLEICLTIFLCKIHSNLFDSSWRAAFLNFMQSAKIVASVAVVVIVIDVLFPFGSFIHSFELHNAHTIIIIITWAWEMIFPRNAFITLVQCTLKQVKHCNRLKQWKYPETRS